VKPVVSLCIASWRSLGCVLVGLVLAACSSSSLKPQPAELPANPKLFNVRQAWSLDAGPVNFPLEMRAVGNAVAVANALGVVTMLDARTGEKLWQLPLGTALSAGVGHDGRRAAVITRENELVVMASGAELWRQRLTATSYTTPLVAGERVFVLNADRSVSAYDGLTGRRLWNQSRQGEPLILRQSGVMLAVGDTLVVGLSGKLVGMNPLNGSARWEVPLASPRGTNDVERLVDLVGPPARIGNVVCARAFQAAVACVDAVRGTLLWTKPANGVVGVQMDENFVFAVEADGTIQAFKRADGERAWSMQQFRWRQLSAPFLAGPSMVVGDDTGLLHFLSRESGAVQNRMSTDGSAIVTQPVVAGNTLVAITQRGGVYGFKPE
jgi:outer membrane protein assembly factor BamB